MIQERVLMGMTLEIVYRTWVPGAGSCWVFQGWRCKNVRM